LPARHFRISRLSKPQRRARSCLRGGHIPATSGGPRVPERQTPGPDGARRQHASIATTQRRRLVTKLPTALRRIRLKTTQPEASNQQGYKSSCQDQSTITMSIGPFLSLSTIRRNTSFVIASPSFSVWSWTMRFPTPRLCGSIARRWPRRARWKSRSV